jgi:hypothetical protein
MSGFLCTGRDGVIRPFRYIYSEELNGTYTFLVYSIPPHPQGDFLQATFTPIDPQTVRQTEMHAPPGPTYRARGIPDSLLPIAAAKLGRTIVSSPSFQAGGGVFRMPDATKVWDRLVARGIATYGPFGKKCNTRLFE